MRLIDATKLQKKVQDLADALPNIAGEEKVQLERFIEMLKDAPTAKAEEKKAAPVKETPKTAAKEPVKAAPNWDNVHKKP
jgi:hypothetical protein